MAILKSDPGCPPFSKSQKSVSATGREEVTLSIRDRFSGATAPGVADGPELTWKKTRST